MRNIIVQILIWEGTVYIPSTARYKNGIYTNIEPVFILDRNVEEIAKAANIIINHGPEILPDPSKEELKTRFELLPKITRAKSWKRLCQKGINYLVGYTTKGISLSFSRPDGRGRWENDPNKEKVYPLDTPISVVISDLLDDYSSRLNSAINQNSV